MHIFPSGNTAAADVWFNPDIWNTDGGGVPIGSFAKLGAQGHTLHAAFFRTAASALDVNDHIVYNRATGNLFYDVNGVGAGGAQLIATFANKPVLVASEFAIV